MLFNLSISLNSRGKLQYTVIIESSHNPFEEACYNQNLDVNSFYIKQKN